MKAKESGARKVYETYWESYLSGNLEVFAETIADEFSLIGSSESEISFGKEKGVELLKAQFDEVVGKAERRNRQVKEIPVGEQVLIIEFCDIYVLMDSEWRFYAKLRLSTLLRQSLNGWKVFQQHGSLPDQMVEGDETIALDKINKENVELRIAVKRRTIELENKSRELEIEASLERVRAVAMGMMKPDDMLNVCKVLYKELHSLDFSELRNTMIHSFEDENEYFINYDFSDAQGGKIARIPVKGHASMESFVSEMRKSNDAFQHLTIAGKELQDWIAFRKTNKEPDDPKLDNIKSLHYYNYSIGESGIGISAYSSISKEKQEILARFRNVFQLAYQRYADITLAEAQAREAMIEAALERVRSRSMAMHKSDELQEVIQEVFSQFVLLNIGVDHTGFILDYKTNTEMHIWLADENDVPSELRIPYFDSPHWNSFIEAKEKGSQFFANYLNFEEKNHFYTGLFAKVFNPSEEVRKFYMECPGLAISTVLLDSIGLYIENFSGTPYSDAENNILLRFAKVFEQSYTRFLDLQKAEAQALEAKIEAALERVRSRSLAMHKSDELNEVVSVLFEKLKDLQIPFTAVGIAIRIDGSKDLNAFVCGQNDAGLVITNYRLPYFNNPIPKDLYKALDRQSDFFVGHYSKEEKDAFYEYVIEHTPEFRHLPEDVKNMIFGSPTYTISMVAVKNAVFNINDFEGKVLADNEIDIIKRFARVFDQAYTRFLDLQKAEAQAREAEIQLALERVRARSMAMHKSEEMLSVIEVVSEQLTQLNLRFDHVSFGRNNKVGDFKFWLSSSGQPKPVLLQVPKLDCSIINTIKEAQKKGIHFITNVFTPEENREWSEHLFEFSELKYFPEKVKGFILSSPGFARSSFLLKNIDMYVGNYRAVPFTKEENAIFQRFAQVFEQSYTRFLDLQKAEAQAREAQIEAALERVRARTMAMQHSEELLEVATVLFQQVKELGVPQWNCGFNIWEPGDEAFTYYPGTPDGVINPSPCKIPLNEHPVFRRFDDSRKKGIDLLVYEKKGDEQNDHYQYMLSLPGVGDLLKSMLNAGFQLPPFQIDHLANFAYGNLIFITYEHFPEMHDVFKRFAKVFEQTYTRFLDLQKAEAQAREAQIEAALERVRSRSMAMHNSDELREAGEILCNEIIKLGIETITSGFVIMDEEEKIGWNYAPDPSTRKIMTVPVGIPHDDTAIMRSIKKAWKKQEPVFIVEMDEKETIVHQTFVAEESINFPISAEQLIAVSPARLKLHNFNFKEGYLLIVGGTRLTGAQENIMLRFTKVFQQTYTRFLDLQKAEAQAREAQIEAALEKVRSRSLAMHKSDELKEVILEVAKKLQDLGIAMENRATAIFTFEAESKDYYQWVASPEYKSIIGFLTPYIDHPVQNDIWNARQKGTDFYAKSYTVQEKNSLFQYFFELPALKSMPQEEKEKALGFKYYDVAIAFEKNSAVAMVSHSGKQLTESESAILRRFTKVFEQTYTRFLDLQKAEARAKESRVELSLERIRAQVTGMQESADLLDIVVAMRTEFVNLGHEAHYFWHMRWLPETYAKAMTSGDGTKIGMVMTLPRHIHGDIKPVADWEKSKDPTYVLAMDVDVAVDYVDKMISLGDFERVDPQAPTLDDIRHIGGLTFVMARTTHGEIGFSLPGVVPDPSKDAVDTLVRFAGVFDLAYKRFEDLKTAEKDLIEIKAARQKAEEALTELRATQSQLVQQEKLASLGQLTAGIAHEIKNPLNFVNNFSEVSVELIDEALEELEKLDDSDTKEEITAILNDVKGNLTKVHEHGTRADGIVKSMLQHSRGGSGKMEPTNLNALVKEYVNLAFHGMRAGKNPINAEIDLQLDPKIKTVPMIGEDFSRVVLNLCNNAFDAMRETVDTLPPKLSVRTKLDSKSIHIEVEDNGSGIPNEIKDKILQPFFTTKKGTDGTGLGLSITNDIIKAHGGQLNIQSQPGSTIFKIHLTLLK